MAITVVGTPVAANATSVGITIPAGTKLLVAGYLSCPYGGMTITGFTCGVDTLSALTGGGQAGIYYKKNPTPGTVTLAYTYTDGYNRGIFGVCFTGGHLVITGSAEADKSITVATRVGDWLVGSHGDGTEQLDGSTPATALLDIYYDPGSGLRGNLNAGYLQAVDVSTAWTVTGGGTVYNETAVARIREESVGNQIMWIA